MHCRQRTVKPQRVALIGLLQDSQHTDVHCNQVESIEFNLSQQLKGLPIKLQNVNLGQLPHVTQSPCMQQFPSNIACIFDSA